MSAELTTVHLIGSLGNAVGRSEWQLDVRSPAEALRAIDINTQGALGNYLRGPARDRLYRIALGNRKNVIDPKEGANRSGRNTIYIMPTIRGRNSSWGKVIAGVVLLVLTYYTGGLAGGVGGWAAAAGSAGAAGTLTFAGSVAVGFGVSLVLGGIAQALTPTPQGPNASPEQAQSTAFPGNASAVVQGGCIPVVYGRALVSPIPVSITVSNNDVSTSAAGTNGGVIAAPLPGGGFQYFPEPGPPIFNADQF